MSKVQSFVLVLDAVVVGVVGGSLLDVRRKTLIRDIIIKELNQYNFTKNIICNRLLFMAMILDKILTW